MAFMRLHEQRMGCSALTSTCQNSGYDQTKPSSTSLGLDASFLMNIVNQEGGGQGCTIKDADVAVSPFDPCSKRDEGGKTLVLASRGVVQGHCSLLSILIIRKDKID